MALLVKKHIPCVYDILPICAYNAESFFNIFLLHSLILNKFNGRSYLYFYPVFLFLCMYVYRFMVICEKEETKPKYFKKCRLIFNIQILCKRRYNILYLQINL